VENRSENDERGRRHERGDQPFLEAIEDPIENATH
jgi:hypothetical protein